MISACVAGRIVVRNLITAPPVSVRVAATGLTRVVKRTAGVAWVIVNATATGLMRVVKRTVGMIGSQRIVGVVLNRAGLGFHRYGYGYGADYLTLPHARAGKNGDP